MLSRCDLITNKACLRLCCPQTNATVLPIISRKTSMYARTTSATSYPNTGQTSYVAFHSLLLTAGRGSGTMYRGSAGRHLCAKAPRLTCQIQVLLQHDDCSKLSRGTHKSPRTTFFVLLGGTREICVAALRTMTSVAYHISSSSLSLIFVSILESAPLSALHSESIDSLTTQLCILHLYRYHSD
jgi:hypothetical protein